MSSNEDFYESPPSRKRKMQSQHEKMKECKVIIRAKIKIKKVNDLDTTDSDEEINISRPRRKCALPRRHAKKLVVNNLEVDDSFDEGSNDSEKLEQVVKRPKHSRINRLLSDDSNEEGNHTSSEACKSEKKISDASNSEDESNLTRRHIRQIKSLRQLNEETRKAHLEEKERRKRLSEKSQDGLVEKYVENGKETYTKVAFELQSGKYPTIEVHEDLLEVLKPHQIEGIRFLWDTVCESSERCISEPGSGAILAHCMGLGKTLQIISFIHTLFRYPHLKLRRFLIIAPMNTILNWCREFEMWLPDDIVDVYYLTQLRDDKDKLQTIATWHSKGGVMLIGYQLFRLYLFPIRKFIKKHSVKFQEYFCDPGPDIVICDEGHTLKNSQTTLSVAINKLKTSRRIILTGTPLQNNLMEYHCMVSFVKPNLLGSKNEFRNRFVNPITNGQQKDSSAHDVQVMKRRTHVLHQLLSGCVQRRDYSYITRVIPPKKEFIIMLRLSPKQIRLYDHYLRLICLNEDFPESHVKDDLSNFVPISRIFKEQLSSKRNLFQDHLVLSRIWTHPWSLTFIGNDNLDKFISDESDLESSQSEVGDKNAPISTFVVSNSDEDDSDEIQSNTDKNSDNDSGTSEDSLMNEVIKKYKTRSRSNTGKDGKEPPSKPAEKVMPTEWYSSFLQSQDEYDFSLSPKLVVFLEILRCAKKCDDKVLVFSQSLMTLNYIEYMLRLLDIAYTEKWTIGEVDEEGVCHTIDGTEAGEGHWIPGVDYLRLDGSTSGPRRKAMVDAFNDAENKDLRLLLISTRAGSLGINLIGANRVVILDCSWNPTHDIQAIFRVYRFGQTKPVYIYRLLAQGTMEERIYNKQVVKESLSLRVVDENQIERHFSKNELCELYTFKPDILKVNSQISGNESQIAAVPDSSKNAAGALHGGESVRESTQMSFPPVLNSTIPPSIQSLRSDKGRFELTPTASSAVKDRIFESIISKWSHLISSFHEHDSLLQNQVDENLTEEEQREAVEEYEKLKNFQNTVSGSSSSSSTPAAKNELNTTVAKMIQWASKVPHPSSAYAIQIMTNFMKDVRDSGIPMDETRLTHEIYLSFPRYFLHKIGFYPVNQF